MPLKIVEDEKSFDPKTFGTAIPRKAIIQMVQNFIHRTFKGPRRITKNYDSHAVHYTKKEIDALFAANGYVPGAPDADQFGLRIYMGVHSNTDIERRSMPRRPAEYLDQHTVILVTTKNNQDLLVDGSSVSTYQIDPGTGLEEGQICPPPKCGTVDDELEP
jgi:hypothetical protein